jgi:hypothetical protein
MFYRRPQLIDSVKENETFEKGKDGKFYIAKDLPLYGFEGFCERLRHAWLVLNDKARAYRFYEDI